MFLWIFSVLTAQKGGWRVQVGSGFFIKGNKFMGHTKEEWNYAGFDKAVFPYPDFSSRHLKVSKYWSIFHRYLQLGVSLNYNIICIRDFKYKYIHHGTWTEIIWDGTDPSSSKGVLFGVSAAVPLIKNKKTDIRVFGDLEKSYHGVFRGTLSALFVSTGLYLSIIQVCLA